ncbi:MAG: endonuclease domain-containing protein [Muribaculaceae bacterium]|nr:endonuclease domain-containing protein [Muribaculaceae bacterium]
MNDKTVKARKLRKNMTEQERKLWQFLRKKSIDGLKFRRQYPIGNYIVDFICNEKKLIIEIDGGQHNEAQNITYDKERTEFLENKGYKVIRFWNCDVDNNIEGVYQEILKNLKN